MSEVDRALFVGWSRRYVRYLSVEKIRINNLGREKFSDLEHLQEFSKSTHNLDFFGKIEKTAL
jgi:phage gp45-like